MLLALRSTPLLCGCSPTELLMGRKFRGVVPIIPHTLHPSLPNYKLVMKKEEKAKAKSKIDFGRHHKAKPLPKVPIGQSVWISHLCQRGTPRFYVVRSDNC